MKILLSLAALVAAVTAFAQGTSQAILGYTNSVSVRIDSITAGWTFEPATPLTVTNLGCFAKVFNDNPVPSVRIGLWAPNGSLLASSTITPGSTLFDQSRYESIAPVQVFPGQTYALGLLYFGDLGLDVANSFAGGVVQVSPEIKSVTVASGTGGFTAPLPETGSPIGAYLGPNFRYDGRVPEPSSWLLLGLGGLLLAARRK
jgi:hypothetical protein